jgi:Icc-related predicted phosphoesterase
MLRIQYVSDLHLEHYKIHTAKELNPLQWIKPDPTADVLVLAGDIGNPHKTSYGLFLQWCAANWPQVVIVAGNHEFYREDMRGDRGEGAGGAKLSPRYEALELIKLITRHYRNVHFLDRGRFTVRPGVHILGCTLWSDIPADMRKYVLQGLNDFRHIPGATFEGYAEWHTRDREWLAAQLRAVAAAGETAIVVTHHLPTPRLISEKYMDHPMNCCFATDLDALIEETVPAAWICGHSHTGNAVQIGATRLALNPHGYIGERVETRNACAILEIEVGAPTAKPLQ